MAAHSPDGKPAPAPHPAGNGAPPTDNVIILCTAPDETCARDLAAKLLDGKLAACVTMLPGALSLYHWEGALEQQQEVQMLIKTHARLQQELMILIKSLHPYHTPELLVLPVLGGDPAYLSWLNASLL